MMKLIGLIPAGGTASRLGKLPCSKEILPFIEKSGNFRVVSANLIHYYKLAGIKEIFMIIRKGKWDIPEYFGDGSAFGVNMGYLIVNCTSGTPFTLSQAYPFVRDKVVALGFPDIVFSPENAFQQLLSKISKTDAQIMLGLVPHKNPEKADMVAFNHDGSIRDIIIKQNRKDLKYSWFIALWKPLFTEFMKHFTDDYIREGIDRIKLKDGTSREIYVGDVIMHAIRNGMKAEYIIFENGFYEDLGTPGALNNYIDKTIS
jgi:glucose-1-phosphate thymidylyltransferase